MTLYTRGGLRILECAGDGKKIQTERDAVELIGEALEGGADFIVIPVEWFEDDFFRLRTGIAGAILQKFVTYRRRLAIVGDISRHVNESTALRHFVYESNRGEHVWFVANIEGLDQRLSRRT